MVTITCDICGNTFKEGNIDDEFEIQEVHQIDFVGGYGSVFGDGTRVKLDICQHCLYIKFKDFIPVQEERLNDF